MRTCRTRRDETGEKKAGSIVKNSKKRANESLDSYRMHQGKSKDLLEAESYLKNIGNRLKEIEEEKIRFSKQI